MIFHDTPRVKRRRSQWVPFCAGFVAGVGSIIGIILAWAWHLF